MTSLEARTDYRPGWYLIEMKAGPPLVRYFTAGEAWLCNPGEFFQPKLMSEAAGMTLSGAADVQMNYTDTCREMICCGPVTQFDPSVWDQVASLPQLLQEMEV